LQSWIGSQRQELLDDSSVPDECNVSTPPAPITTSEDSFPARLLPLLPIHPVQRSPLPHLSRLHGRHLKKAGKQDNWAKLIASTHIILRIIVIRLLFLNLELIAFSVCSLYISSTRTHNFIAASQSIAVPLLKLFKLRRRVCDAPPAEALKVSLDRIRGDMWLWTGGVVVWWHLSSTPDSIWPC